MIGEPLPLWMAETRGPGFPALDGDHTVDVAVVGAGITGITAAWLCKRAGLTVVLLDAHKVAGGETGHTTSHLTEMLDHRYHVIAHKHGKAKALKVAQSQRAAIEWIATRVDQDRIDCGFKRVPGYLYTENPRDLRDLIIELRATREVRIDSSMVDAVPLPFHTRGALRLENQAQIDPRRYLLPLALRIPGDGSFVFEHSRVTSVEKGEPAMVRTDRGTITARHVVLATDAVINGLTLMTKVAAYRSYALAASVTNMPPPGLYWDTEDPYHYLRTQQTQRGETLLIVGGEDHKVGQEPDELSRFAKLEEYVRGRFRVSSIDYRWSGQIIEPSDGLPYIGRHSSADNLYVATGYSGTGMTFGTAAGMLMSDLILGVQNPWEDVYNPKRFKPLASAKEYIRENVDFPLHLVGDRVSPADIQSPEQLAKGEGGLLHAGAKKVALYRDDGGELHALNPTCTHMGCQVGWNNAEKSWDCPCHGGRFDAKGHVLHGPPTKDLEVLDPKDLKQPQGERTDERTGTSEDPSP